MNNQAIRILRVILLIIAVLAFAILWNVIMNGLGTVHNASRTNKKLNDIEKAGMDFRPTTEQYQEACRDAIAIRSASLQSVDVSFYGGGILCVLALVAFGITFRLTRREFAQPPAEPYSAPAARSPQG